MKKNDKNLMNTGESSLGGGIKKKLQKDITPYLVFAIPLTFMAIFLVYPMVTTLMRAFMPAGNKMVLGSFSLKGFTKFFESSMYQKALANSFIVSISVTLLCIAIGVPMGLSLIHI